MIISSIHSDSAISSLFLLLLLPVFFATGCGPSEEEARNELIEMGFEYSRSGFFEAVEEGNVDSSVVKLYLQAGMSSDVKNEDGITPLFEAASVGAFRVKTLLEHDADPNVQGYNGNTPLHEAASTQNNSESVRLLLEAGADPTAQNEYERSPIHLAAQTSNNLESIKLLHEAGVDPNVQGYNGRTPLQEATNAYALNSETVKILLDLGADPNVQDEESGVTPLHVAADRLSAESVRLLLEAGADPSVKDENGETPLDKAMSSTSFNNPDSKKKIYGMLKSEAAKGTPDSAQKSKTPDWMGHWKVLNREEENTSYYDINEGRFTLITDTGSDGCEISNVDLATNGDILMIGGTAKNALKAEAEVSKDTLTLTYLEDPRNPDNVGRQDRAKAVDSDPRDLADCSQ